MPVSRRKYDDLHARYEAQVTKTAEAEADREGAVTVAAQALHHRDVLAQVVAVHIVTAEKNGTDIRPAVLRAAIERARLDLSIEYACASSEGAAL